VPSTLRGDGIGTFTNRASGGNAPAAGFAFPARQLEVPPRMAVPEPTDADLDDLAQTYWALLGIDISVLPVDDPTAVADQARCLANARSTLRGEVPIQDYAGLDPQADLAVLYPVPFAQWTANGGRR
jgi:hypothetical protein